MYSLYENNALSLQPEFVSKDYIGKITNKKYIVQLKISITMTKADIVTKIANNTGINKDDVLKTVESFMECVKNSLIEKENVYLRGFGSFIIKERAEKTARNISKNVTIKIPAHSIPAFKPSKEFVSKVK